MGNKNLVITLYVENKEKDVIAVNYKYVAKIIAFSVKLYLFVSKLKKKENKFFFKYLNVYINTYSVNNSVFFNIFSH